MHNVYDYVKQALEGEEKSEMQHDIGIFKRCTELTSKYGIKYDGAGFVPMDMKLADSVFEAGVELLLSVGIYCMNTSKTIKIDEEDVLKSLHTSKSLEISGD